MNRKAKVALIIAAILVFVGIVAATAIPSHRDYTIRAKIYEVVAIGVQASEAVEKFIAQNNGYPTKMEQTGFSVTSPLLKSITVNGQSGEVRLTTNFSPFEDKAILFAPSLDENKKIIWKCISDGIASEYLPASRCRQ